MKTLPFHSLSRSLMTIIVSPPWHTRLVAFERKVRLITGLILFSFASCHLINHACGILRLGPMEAVRQVLLWPWRTMIGQVALYGSFAIHTCLGLYAIYRRRHLRIPRAEFFQILLGLSIPPLVIIHATNVRLGHILFDLDISYSKVLYRYWVLSPLYGLSRQFALLMVLWFHGCIGLNSFLRFRPWYQNWLPALATIATLIPLLAVIGIADAGRDLDLYLAQDRGFLQTVDVQTKAQSAALAELGNQLILGYLAIVALVCVLRILRKWREQRRQALNIFYPQEKMVRVPRGFSVLEASRWAGIPHMSMCGGRGRCSTCRVLVTAGLEDLPVPNMQEARTLAAIGADRRLRLACQVRPKDNCGVVPLLSPDQLPINKLTSVFTTSGEYEIAAFFVDLRNSTRLADGRLPYDAIYIIDRYAAAVCSAIEAYKGRVTSIAGDGVMCFFGADCNGATAARRALFAQRDLWHSLAVLDKEFERAFDFPLRFGIGAHVGLAVVGDCINLHTIQFLGEVGNIAARFEGLTKEFACTIVVSRELLERAGLAADHLEMHRVRIKNVTTEIDIAVFRTQDEFEHLLSVIDLARS